MNDGGFNRGQQFPGTRGRPPVPPRSRLPKCLPVRILEDPGEEGLEVRQEVGALNERRGGEVLQDGVVRRLQVLRGDRKRLVLKR